MFIRVVLVIGELLHDTSSAMILLICATSLPIMVPSVAVMVREVMTTASLDRDLVSAEMIILVEDIRAWSRQSSRDEGTYYGTDREESHDGLG